MKQHTSQFLTLVTDAKSRIQEITPQTLKTKLDNNEKLCIIDVREDNEWQTGHIPDAIHLSKGTIERDIEKHITNFQTPIAVYCSGGFRSALVADNLQKMGYTNVCSVNGGLTAWLQAGYQLIKT